jgi:outer membrane protein assembly factor BamC
MRKVLSAASLCLLAGCSALSDNNIDYKSQGTLPPLEIPPDLTSPTRDNRFVVPDAGRATATLSGYQQERREGRTNTTLLPQPGAEMRIERAGAERWLVVNEPVDRLWPLVKDFWQELGFLIKTEIPEAGVMETDWAEDRAKIPGGMVRDLLGRVFDNLHSTPIRDKFRTRLERTADGKGTEIYVSHRGVEEVYADAGTVTGGNIRTVWQSRPTDTGLEAEFLRRLMVRLGEREERAKHAVQPQSTQPRARIVKSSDGAEQLQVSEPFDRAWRRVGLALDRVGFTVEDRDRQNGVYFVRYADADAEREKQGLLSRIIGTKPEIKPEQYRVQVRSEQDASRVNVLNKDGAAETSPTGQRILTLLHEQLK